jgi:hypothetical protein
MEHCTSESFAVQVSRKVGQEVEEMVGAFTACGGRVGAGNGHVERKRSCSQVIEQVERDKVALHLGLLRHVVMTESKIQEVRERWPGR